MDSRKRPPSTTPSASSASPAKKKSKGNNNNNNKSKTKKTKKNRSNSMMMEGGGTGAAATTTTTTLGTGGGTKGASTGTATTTTTSSATTTTSTSNLKTNKNSNKESTATTDGQMMAQMLSTFSRLEQSRFEAFQRSSFPVDAVGDWVAACLSHRWNVDPLSSSEQPQQDNNNEQLRRRPHRRRRSHRPLEDLVAVGQASEIRTVVAVLAKTYAQRLVQTAAKLASAANAAASSTDAPPLPAGTTALQPSDIVRAYDHRKALGLDPGFFLQSAKERPDFVIQSSKEAFQQARLAALNAQEEYDLQYPTTTATTTTTQNNNDSGAGAAAADVMDTT